MSSPPARPCSSLIRRDLAAASATGANTADQLTSYYAMSTLYGLSDLGQGVHVGLAEFEPNSAIDINAYRSCYGMHTSVSYVTIDGGAGSGTGSGEAGGRRHLPVNTRAMDRRVRARAIHGTRRAPPHTLMRPRTTRSPPSIARPARPVAELPARQAPPGPSTVRT